MLIEIRNEDVFRIPPDRNWPSACTTPAEWPYNPQRPDIKGPEVFFPSVLSAPLTIFNTRTGHVRGYEGELESDARAAWIRAGVVPPEKDPQSCGPLKDWIGTQPVHRFDLVDDGTLYPSGWLLSTRAMAGICARAVWNTPPVPTPAEAKDYCAPKVARNR